MESLKASECQAQVFSFFILSVESASAFEEQGMMLINNTC